MDMEVNKIFGALLTAGIISMLCWFVSHLAFEHEPLEKNAYEIAGASGGGETPGAPAAATEAEPIDVAKADIAQGQKVSAVCSSCHTMGKGEPNKVGPNLFGIVGSAHARTSDYAYSDAMKGHAGEKWDYDALNKFLWSPQKTVPGTKMTFAGLKKPEDRAAVIKWLESQK
ncbi:MAG: cytochrome c family protein [Alphaproteobacteria bacterium]|nr:MAG: cytochrome c family protein [Alphaproteobacteria bacterium]